MIKRIFKIIIPLIILLINIHSVNADMNDPLQSRISPGIIAKLFPNAESLGAPIGNPPYIPVFGNEDSSAIDVNILHSWRQEFLQVNAREPTKEEEEEKINSLKKKGDKKEIGFLFSTYETTGAKIGRASCRERV